MTAHTVSSSCHVSRNHDGSYDVRMDSREGARLRVYTERDARFLELADNFILEARGPKEPEKPEKKRRRRRRSR